MKDYLDAVCRQDEIGLESGTSGPLTAEEHSMRRFAAVRLFVLSALLFLAGCFDYTEQLSFNEQGAGKLAIVFDLGDLGPAEKLLAALIKKNPINKENLEKGLPAGVKLSEYREEVKNEHKIIYATYDFDDMNKLALWKVNDKDDLIFRTISLVRVGETWAFKRTFHAKDADQLENAKKHLARSRIVFKLTGPGKLVDGQHNAQRVENGNTCVWEGSFPEFLEGKDGQGTEIHAQFFVGTPPLVKALIGGGVLLIVVCAALLLWKKKAAPGAASPTQPT